MSDVVDTACPACTQAKRNPLTGAYRAGCFECSARSIANSPTFFDAQRVARDGLPMSMLYRDALQRAFGGAWPEGHKRAKWWWERMQGEAE